MPNPNTIKRRWLKEDEDAVSGAITALLQHAQGRKFLWWCLQIGRFGTQPFAGNALTTSFACGELNVGQQFFDRISSVSPEGFIQMMKEQADERTRRDAELTRASAPNGGNGVGDEPEPESSDGGEAE